MENVYDSAVKAANHTSFVKTDTDGEVEYKILTTSYGVVTGSDSDEAATAAAAAADDDDDANDESASDYSTSGSDCTPSSPSSPENASSPLSHSNTICEEHCQLLESDDESNRIVSQCDTDHMPTAFHYTSAAAASAASSSGSQPADDASADVWTVNEKQYQYYRRQFLSLQPDIGGVVDGRTAKAFFEKSKLAVSVLSQVWNLADVTKDGCLCLQEFIVAMHLVVLQRHGISVPNQLPASLRPQPNRGDNESLNLTLSANNSLELSSPKSQEWTKFVDSPLSVAASPDIKPVNFDFNRRSLVHNPRIAHPLAVRGTLEEHERLRSDDSDYQYDDDDDDNDDDDDDNNDDDNDRGNNDNHFRLHHHHQQQQQQQPSSLRLGGREESHRLPDGFEGDSGGAAGGGGVSLFGDASVTSHRPPPLTAFSRVTAKQPATHNVMLSPDGGGGGGGPTSLPVYTRTPRVRSLLHQPPPVPPPRTLTATGSVPPLPPPPPAAVAAAAGGGSSSSGSGGGGVSSGGGGGASSKHTRSSSLDLILSQPTPPRRPRRSPLNTQRRASQCVSTAGTETEEGATAAAAAAAGGDGGDDTQFANFGQFADSAFGQLVYDSGHSTCFDAFPSSAASDSVDAAGELSTAAAAAAGSCVEPPLSPGRLSGLDAKQLLELAGQLELGQLQQLERVQRERTLTLTQVGHELRQELAETVEERAGLQVRLQQLSTSHHHHQLQQQQH